VQLAENGYLRRASSKSNKKSGKPSKLKPLAYKSSDGFLIFCGRNNTQNDKLTLKDSEKSDIWLHTQKIPGSHVIIAGGGKEVPDSTIEEAAVIAAYNSKGRGSAKVAVDYAKVKNVRKPGGAKPGMVIYDNYKTILANPDEMLVKKLAVDE
jgi:predicted ribosome quality control (RQC) complex YloA/Tae2 family protein